MSQDSRYDLLCQIHEQLDLAAPAKSDLIGRWAIIRVAPDERRGAPEMTIEAFDGPLADVAAKAREGLGDVLYPMMPVQVVDLDSGARLAPVWESLTWRELVPQFRPPG